MFTAALAAISPTEADAQLARRCSRLLAPFLAGDETPVLTVADAGGRAELTLPAEIFCLLAYVLAEVGHGRGVAVLPLEFELTERQAADLLNISHSYLVTLLNDQEIPSRQAGDYRRVKLMDVIAYKRHFLEERMKVLDELAAEAQDLKMGYD